MKFRNKIIITYTVFLVIITFIFSGMFYMINANHYIEREFETIRTSSNVKQQQMENIIRDMESAIHIVLSDIEVINALREFSVTRFDSFEELLFDDASTTIRLKVNSFYLSDRFYRITVFNHRGNAISNNTFRENRGLNTNATIEDFPYLDKVIDRGGRNTLIGLHSDIWGSTYRPSVISMVVGIEGMNLGFIEVQMSKESLDSILVTLEDNYDYIFFTDSMDLLYSSNMSLSPEYYLDFITGYDNEVHEVIKDNGDRAFVHASRSEDYGFYLLTISNTNIRGELIRAVLPLSSFLVLGGIFVSVIYISFTSRKLTKPIHQLQYFMENTQLENMMETEIPEKISNDEMDSLYIAYKDLLKRLNASMLKEERLSIMQLQAQFDLLQAQVNPHFIYNVLNVISGRALLSDDDKICEICSELAGMLRYSTNTKDKYATVKQEVEYLELYLGLLKHRYHDKLTYHISLADDLQDKLLPRIVLQQIVENSINHGQSIANGTIHIEVIGETTASGWRLRIIDNGSGISSEKIAEIRQSMAEVKSRLSSNRHHVELEIGGMGLVNTYARLYILYPEELEFEILSSPDKGTEVAICIR